MAFRLNQQSYPFNPNASQINTANTVFSGQPANTTTQQASPALSAMASSPVATAPMSTQLGQPKATLPQAPAAGVASAAAAPARPDLVTPTQVDTSKADQLYGQQMANYQQGWDTQQKQNNILWSRMQMGNASNAARAGMSIGGGSYLAGQRQAGIAATNANNQATLDWLKGQADMTGQQIGRAYGAAGQNAGLKQGADIFNAGREGDLADKRTDVQATHDANQGTGSVAQVKADYDYLFNDHNFKEGAGQYGSLLTAYTNSLSTGSPEEQAAAYKALMDFITPIQTARQQWISTGGQDKNGDFAKWYKAHGGK